MWWPLSKIGAEIYRRFITSLDEFQNVRVIDTGEFVPDSERGQMYTYQLRVYNLSHSSPIKNPRAKLSITTGFPGVTAETETSLCWAPDKGKVSINRGDHEWLNLATVNGAKAAGFDNVGALREGWRADIIGIDTDLTRAVPLHDVFSHLVFAARGTDVAFTMVDGTVLMEDGKVTVVDADEIRRRASAIGDKLDLEESGNAA